MVQLRGIDLINACKVATAAMLGAFAYMYGFQTFRSHLYLALHGTYLLWWFIHQRLSPTWGPTVFGASDMPLPVVAVTFLIVGPGYSLPGYFAFTNTATPSPWLIVAATQLFALGSLINAGADFYKDGFKAANPTSVVMSGPYRIARHINWFGDWMRYGSFALVSGHPLGLLPLAFTMFINLIGLKQRTSGQASRGGAEFEKYLANTPAVLPWRLLL